MDSPARPQERRQVTTTAGEPLTLLGLLGELRELRAENKRLRRQVSALEASRDRWRSESRSWQWGFLRRERRAARREAVSSNGRAEASVGG